MLNGGRDKHVPPEWKGLFTHCLDGTPVHLAVADLLRSPRRGTLVVPGESEWMI
ncbi:MAG: hypothetical protein KatS3mg112_1196 [Thermogutta sp.]|nr:MAG: hypothetical protein KatS3mg112_1196 [Thermogutta sp.]